MLLIDRDDGPSRSEGKNGGHHNALGESAPSAAAHFLGSQGEIRALRGADW